MHCAGTVIWEDGRRAMFDCGFDRCLAQLMEALSQPLQCAIYRHPVHNLLADLIFHAACLFWLVVIAI